MDREELKEFAVRTAMMILLIITAIVGSFIVTGLMYFSLWWILSIIPITIILFIIYAYILEKIGEWYG